MRSEFNGAGGAAHFGALRYAVGSESGTGCKVAVFNSGAVSEKGGVARVIDGAVFSKWSALLNGSKQPTLGCALDAQHAASGGAQTQDFEHGRIYTGTPNGTTYVPAILRDAFAGLGGDAELGLPTSDPTSALPSPFFITSMQRFNKAGVVGAPTTFELNSRGGTFKLLVERQQMTDFDDLPLPGNHATLTHEYPCSGTPLTCSVVIPDGAKVPQSTTNGLCPGFQSPSGGNELPNYSGPQWVPILGQHVTSSLWGFAAESHMSSEDAPWDHSYKFNCIDLDGVLNGKVCESDWNVHLKPLDGYKHMTLEGGEDDLELEYESYYAQHMRVFDDDPRPGDLVFAAGRWIADCYHPPFSTEIHPPGILAYLRSDTLNGKPATRAGVWVNGFFTGDQTVDVDIFPPPRPSPQATLMVERSKLGDDIGVTVQDMMWMGDRLRLRVSAPTRTNPVSSFGEFGWLSGRQYEAVWLVSWSEPPPVVFTPMTPVTGIKL